MPQLLHIITRPDDSLAQEIISRQKQDTGNQVEVVDLTAGEPDYRELARKIFAADSVEVW